MPALLPSSLTLSPFLKPPSPTRSPTASPQPPPRVPSHPTRPPIPAASASAASLPLIRNLCRRGRTPDAARVLLTAEGSGSPVDVFAYNTLVTGYCRYDHLDTARRLIGSVPVAPDA
uniref:Pentatricopeptide repeat-containing protein n=1 Tax=Zea mays TaxID=4577 RepID=A0A804NCG5_MAIZE